MWPTRRKNKGIFGPIHLMAPGYYPQGAVLLGTDERGTHAVECTAAETDRPCRECFFADYPDVCNRMLCAPGKRADKTAVRFKELKDKSITTMRYRITGFRVWHGDREEGSEELGRSPYLTPAQLTAEREKIRARYAKKIADELTIDFSLKAETKTKREDDEEADD